MLTLRPFEADLEPVSFKRGIDFSSAAFYVVFENFSSRSEDCSVIRKNTAGK